MKAKNGPNLRRLIFVNRFFYPDESATAQILSDLAFHLAHNAQEVTIITSRLDYSDTSTRYPSVEALNGVQIKRVFTTGFGRAGLIGRTIDYLSFYLSSFLCALCVVQKGDFLVAKTDPPLISVLMGIVARLKGAIFMNWLQDLFPEVGIELGVRPPLTRLLFWLRDRSLRRAHRNIVIGNRMRDRIIARGVDATNVKVIHNFVNDEALIPNAKGVLDLREAWGFTPKDFIIGYSGNLGRAHDVATMLEAAEILSNEKHLKFLFVGGGHLRKQIEIEAEERQLQNVVFKPYQPRSMLAQSLSVPNVHWASLNPQLEGLIVPSKLYGITAVGRPVIMIGDPDGEIGRHVKAHKFGFVVQPGESELLAKMLVGMMHNTTINIASLGKAARTFTDSHGSRELAFTYWEDTFSS